MLGKEAPRTDEGTDVEEEEGEEGGKRLRADEARCFDKASSNNDDMEGLRQRAVVGECGGWVGQTNGLVYCTYSGGVSEEEEGWDRESRGRASVGCVSIRADQEYNV